jgi:hypothetical protein
MVPDPGPKLARTPAQPSTQLGTLEMKSRRLAGLLT